MIDKRPIRHSSIRPPFIHQDTANTKSPDVITDLFQPV
jgi:hypothetical protein